MQSVCRGTGLRTAALEHMILKLMNPLDSLKRELHFIYE